MSDFFKTKIGVISGIIGSGKSTWCNHLENQGHDVYYERSDENPFLKHFYEDPKEWCLPTQLFFTHLRLQSHLGITQGFLDRCVKEDSVFMKVSIDNGYVTQKEAEIYFRNSEKAQKLIGNPDFVIFLDVRPDICYERMRSRMLKRSAEISDDIEFGVPIEYLEKIGEKYKEFISEMGTKVPVYVVPWDDDCKDEQSRHKSILEVMEKIEKSMKEDPCPGIKKIERN